VFQSTGHKPQRPAWHQLAVFLRHYGNVNQHHINTARDCGVSQGSVFLYIDRVITALRSLGRKRVCWPEGDARDEIKAAYADTGFPGCLGAIDGSLIQLAFIPEENPIVYYCRKKFYGVRTVNIFFFVSLLTPDLSRLMSAVLSTYLVNSLITTSDGPVARMISPYITARIFIRSDGNTLLMESTFSVIEVGLFISFASGLHDYLAGRICDDKIPCSTFQ
jgi:hypothetical protein